MKALSRSATEAPQVTKDRMRFARDASGPGIGSCSQVANLPRRVEVSCNSQTMPVWRGFNAISIGARLAWSNAKTGEQKFCPAELLQGAACVREP